MAHIKDKDELWTLALLEQIIQRDRQDRDALSGVVVKHVKKAATIIRKRQAAKRIKRPRGQIF